MNPNVTEALRNQFLDDAQDALSPYGLWADNDSLAGALGPVLVKHLLPIVKGIMLADHLGDVRDELDVLTATFLGWTLEGYSDDEWTREDFDRVGLEWCED